MSMLTSKPWCFSAQVRHISVKLYWKHIQVNYDVNVCSLADHSGVDGTIQIERFHEKAYMELQDYVSKVYPEDTYRWALTALFHSKNETFSDIGKIILSENANWLFQLL